MGFLGISIEDLVPFPTVEETKSVSSDGCCTEDHGMIDAGTAPIDERMCLLGSRCDTQERIACRKRLRRYAAMMQSLAESPQDVETRTSTEAIQEEYQSTHHLLLLLLLTLSMFIVSYFPSACLLYFPFANFWASIPDK